MPAKKKSRDGHAVKRSDTSPASVEENAPAQLDPVSFDPKAIADACNLWRLNSKDATYFLPAESGEDWRESNEREVRRFLKGKGVRTKEDSRDQLTQADEVFEYVSNYRMVDFSGPLAGHRAGVHRTATGAPFIVRSGPRLIEPKEGEWPVIQSMLRAKFADKERMQMERWNLWHKLAIVPLYSGHITRGHLLGLVGTNDSGKTFLLHHVTTPCLGGREADPTNFFKNDAGFNKNMMASEHMHMSEFDFPANFESRRTLSEKFKKIIANEAQSYHPKGKDEVTVTVHLRLSIAINDNLEKLRAFPPMTSDIVDKIILLKVQGQTMPMPTDTEEEKAAFRAVIRAELPAYIHYLLNWEPPAEIAGGRFGMKAWQHPEIVEALWDQEPSSQFEFWLDRELFPADHETGVASCQWETVGWIKLEALADRLTSPSATYHEKFRHLAKLGGGAAFGQYLGRLHKKELDRVGKERSVSPAEIQDADPALRVAKMHDRDKGNFWQIRPPAR